MSREDMGREGWERRRMRRGCDISIMGWWGRKMVKAWMHERWFWEEFELSGYGSTNFGPIARGFISQKIHRFCEILEIDIVSSLISTSRHVDLQSRYRTPSLFLFDAPSAERSLIWLVLPQSHPLASSSSLSPSPIHSCSSSR